MSSDEETENVKAKTSKSECHTTPKPVSKRACSEEQLERLKNMRVKALEARKAKAEARKDEARRRVEEKEEAKVTKELKKLAAAKKRPTPKEVDSGSDSDGGSPPEAVARRPPSIDVEKPRRRRKPVKVAVEASSSDSETEIVIRRPSRKGKAKKPSATVSSVDEEPPTPAPIGKMYSAEEVHAMMDEKLKGFKKTIDDDEISKLIRHMMPNFKG